MHASTTLLTETVIETVLTFPRLVDPQIINLFLRTGVKLGWIESHNVVPLDVVAMW